ncbi:MAG: hypothetical protein HYT31_01925 [Parcubacteria group bacterium]|nr:hypothetical protein [Parcubacteria group bacterium]
MVVVVADSGPIISLARINQLSLLQDVFTHITVSGGVFNELVVRGKGKTGATEIAHAHKTGWLVVESIPDSAAIPELATFGISRADAESIILAERKKADFLLLDEKLEREAARAVLTKTRLLGLGGFLVYAKTAGHIPEVASMLARLRAENVWIGESVRREILEAAGE